MALCSAKAYAAVPSLDSQLWSELDVTRAVGAELSATAIITTRLADGLPNPTVTAGALQIDYRIGSWMVSGTGYYVSVRSAEIGARIGVWLPAAALTYGIDAGRLALSDRNRVERLEGLPRSPTRYRNRANAYWHVAGGNESPEIFIADEAYYDFVRERWTRNRAQAAFQLQVSADAKLQVFYMRQNNTYGTPDRLNVLGLTLQLDIK
jgi:hypothetical protein